MTDRLKKLEHIIKSFTCACPVDTCRKLGDTLALASQCETARIAASRNVIDRELGPLTEPEVVAAIQFGRRYIQREPEISPEFARDLAAVVRKHMP